MSNNNEGTGLRELAVVLDKVVESMLRDKKAAVWWIIDVAEVSRALSAVAPPPVSAQQTWRCTRRFEDDGGIVKEIKYAKTEQDMLILQDQGFTCTALTSTAAKA